MSDHILCNDESLNRRDAIAIAHREAERLLRQVWVISRSGYLLVLLPEGLRPGDLLVHSA